MKQREKSTKLSHIVVCVDKMTPEEVVWSFCTNIQSENPEIRFTYLCYDNQIDDGLCKLNNFFNNISDKNEYLLITDSGEISDWANNNDLPCVGYITPYNGEEYFAGILYCIEDIELITYERLVKMWQRFLNIPWEIIRTKRMIIREQTTEDIDELYEIYKDPSTVMYMEDLYEDRGKEEQYLRDYIDHQYRFYEFGVWALVDTISGELVGRAGLSVRDGYSEPELGYVVGAKYRGKGYAYEACSAILEYAQKELGYSEFIAFTESENKASVSLLIKLGFADGGNVTLTDRETRMYKLIRKNV